MSRTRTTIACSAAAVSLALIPTAVSVSYLVRLLTAALAIVVLLRVGAAPGRTSRVLIAAALLAGIASGVMATLHLVVTGHPSPPGGAADWIYLSYVPLAIAGLLALPRHPSERPWRLRALSDAAVAVGALAFLVVELLLDMAGNSTQSLAAKSAALGYPLGAVSVLAVLLAVLPRAQAQLRPFLHVAGAGIALLTVSDVGYSVGTLHGWYSPTTWPALAAQAGLLLVAAAPLRGRSTLRLIEHEPAAPSLLEVAAPMLAVIPCAGLAVSIVVRGDSLTSPQLVIGIVIGLALVLRQILTSADQQHTIERLRVREIDAVKTARQDPLTGLANRTALHEELALLLAEQSAHVVTLALLDLDDFKDINDTHGHDTGDAVLREVARRLTKAAPAGALIARLGGDEFAVCARADRSPEALGRALVALFDEPIQVGRRPFGVTASIGVVLADAGSTPHPAVALSHVDVAMYQAKASKEPHRSGLVVLTGRDREQATARVLMREEVSRPNLEEFHLVYEPMVDLSDGSLVGAEALLRWDHPVLGSIAPTEFIALAEQVGAIGQLGEFALRTAVGDLARWLDEAKQSGLPLLRGAVGVNLSPRQLDSPGLCDLVRSVLAEHNLHPSRLVLEITEQALLDDWATVVDVVRELRAMGVWVAVDDFGTGYSSLRYLRRFDTSTVKIDREFIQALADEPRTQALVSSVLAMVHSLDLHSVAEGIETLDQLQILRQLGCRYAQGYLFAKPMRADAFGALLVGRHRYPMGSSPDAAVLPVPRPNTDGARPILTVLPRRLG